MLKPTLHSQFIPRQGSGFNDRKSYKLIIATTGHFLCVEGLLEAAVFQLHNSSVSGPLFCEGAVLLDIRQKLIAYCRTMVVLAGFGDDGLEHLDLDWLQETYEHFVELNRYQHLIQLLSEENANV